MRQRKLIEEDTLGGAKTECDNGKTVSTAIAHDCEAHLFELRGEVIRCVGEVAHDGLVTPSTETNHLVILGDDVGSGLGEVQREIQLVRSEVVDVEDELFGEVLG